ncbi:MAG TPA: hypothetical protein PLS05_05235, partial [Clostridia bacterium]|nr:hypothetical protein [Clostridia bacterium]HOL61264.1 hypothetical protein [Clostridia bacterium]
QGEQGPPGPQGPQGEQGPPGELSTAFIFARRLIAGTVETTNPIPFPFTILSRDISLNAPANDTFTFAQSGYYLLTLTLATDIQQITVVVNTSGGPQATTYSFLAGSDNKAITVLLNIPDAGDTMQLINTLGPGNINFANLTIVKVAEI